MNNSSIRITISVDPATMRKLEVLTDQMAIASGLHWGTCSDIIARVHDRFSPLSDAANLQEIATNIQQQANRLNN